MRVSRSFTAARSRWFQPLSSTSRTGGYARQLMWRQVREVLGKIWRQLAIAVGLLGLACVGLALRTAGVLRGFVLGAGLGVLAMFIVGFVFALSGATSLLSSAMAESTTATDLNRLKRSGWRVVHGFRLKVKSDIDHVAIGPGGVLVVETKWSADEWPADRSSSGYMARRVQEAIVQTEKAVRRVTATFGEVTKRRGITRGLLVLNSPRSTTPWAPYTVGFTTVMRAGSLEDWLSTLPAGLLPADEVRDLARAVATKDAELAQREAALGTTVPPTLNQLVNRWAITAPVTASVTILVLGTLAVWGGWWGWGAGALASVIAVRRCWPWKAWRPAIIGLAIGEAVLFGVVVVGSVRYVLAR